MPRLPHFIVTIASMAKVGIQDWDFVIFEQCQTHAKLKEKEIFCQHRLKTFYPIGLTEKEEYLY